MAPASVTSVRAFAAAEGRTIDVSERRRPSRLERGVLRGLLKMHMTRLAAPLDARQLRIIQHRGTTGSLLFRWGVANIRSRYSELARTEKPSAAD